MFKSFHKIDYAGMNNSFEVQRNIPINSWIMDLENMEILKNCQNGNEKHYINICLCSDGR